MTVRLSALLHLLVRRVRTVRTWLHAPKPGLRNRIVWLLCWAILFALIVTAMTWVFDRDRADSAEPTLEPADLNQFCIDEQGNPFPCGTWRHPRSGKAVQHFFVQRKYGRVAMQQKPWLRRLVRRLEVGDIALTGSRCVWIARLNRRQGLNYSPSECSVTPSRRGFLDNVTQQEVKSAAYICGSSAIFARLAHGGPWLVGGGAALCVAQRMYEANQTDRHARREAIRSIFQRAAADGRLIIG